MEMTLSDGTISTFEVSYGSQSVPLSGSLSAMIVVGVWVQVANTSVMRRGCVDHSIDACQLSLAIVKAAFEDGCAAGITLHARPTL